jgi:hypothetical protein
MKNRFAAILLLLPLSVSAASEYQYTLTARLQALPLNTASAGGVPLKDVWFDYDNAVLQQSYVIDLIKSTTGNCHGSGKIIEKCNDPNKKGDFPGKDDYIIFHVVNWGGASSGSTLTATKQNWYVYNSDSGWDYTAFTGTRIFGKKQIYLFTIHLNLPPGTEYEDRYAVDVKSKTKAFLNDLFAVGQLFELQTNGGGVGSVPTDAWYAFALDVKEMPVPSDIQITPAIAPLTASQSPASPPAAPAAPQPKPPSESLGLPPDEVPSSGSAPEPPPLPPAIAPVKTAAGKQTDAGTTSGKSVTLDPKTFDNEGRYHIDFSVAVPITKISDVSFVQASNTLAPTNVQQQKFFAVVDYYPVAVDVKNAVFPKYPYLLTGAAIGSQPLKKAIFGVGWGPLYANFYAALLLNTQAVPGGWKCGNSVPSLSSGQTLSNHTCPEFNFGLNVAAGAIADALMNKGSSQSK